MNRQFSGSHLKEGPCARTSRRKRPGSHWRNLSRYVPQVPKRPIGSALSKPTKFLKVARSFHIILSPLAAQPRDHLQSAPQSPRLYSPATVFSPSGCYGGDSASSCSCCVRDRWWLPGLHSFCSRPFSRPRPCHALGSADSELGPGFSIRRCHRLDGRVRPWAGASPCRPDEKTLAQQSQRRRPSHRAEDA